MQGRRPSMRCAINIGGECRESRNFLLSDTRASYLVGYAPRGRPKRLANLKANRQLPMHCASARCVAGACLIFRAECEALPRRPGISGLIGHDPINPSALRRSLATAWLLNPKDWPALRFSRSAIGCRVEEAWNRSRLPEPHARHARRCPRHASATIDPEAPIGRRNAQPRHGDPL